MPALPSFEAPPLVEVAISTQFNELPNLKPVHFGLLWERLRDRYPITEHHPPVGSAVELFGASGFQRVSMNIESGFPVGRCWYMTEDRSRLIQLQANRFALNWRKIDDAAQYPRYEVLREQFQDELAILLQFFDDESLGEFEPTQCEVTYVNQLPAGEGWTVKNELPRILAPWSGATTESYLPDLEDASLAWQYRFDNGKTPLGRLHVQLNSAVRKDGVSLFVLQLVARGGPVGEGVEGVLEFTDHAHEWIVNGFTAITTRDMHDLWKREQ